MKKRFVRPKTAMKIIQMIFSVALITGVFSCDKHTIEFPEEGYVSYSTSIQPIFNKDCKLCHSGSQNPNLSEGSSYASLTSNGYVDTDDPQSSLLYTKLQGSHSSYTSSANKDMILEWIQAGAPND